MTRLNSTYTRGFFDPITLGFHVPDNFRDMNLYRDDITVKTFATFVHELTHYLQFYGTPFGYFNLLSIGIMVDFIEAMFSKLNKKGDLKFPLIEHAEPLSKEFDRDSYVKVKLSSRFYLEEIYGYTYSHFGDLQPIKLNKHYIFSSPLFLHDSEFEIFPVTGELILENSACCNEIIALSKDYQRDIVNKFVEEQYYSLGKPEQHKYSGISTWLGSFDIMDLEPLIYFIVLNQSPEGFMRNQGDFVLVSNLKKILNQYDKLREFKLPVNNNETKEIINKICLLAGLQDPFDVIQKYIEDIGSYIESWNDTNSWITFEIFKWYMKEPYWAIFWSNDISKMLNSIPILKINFADNKDETFSFLHTKISKKEISILHKHHEYCEKVHIYWGLYNEEKIKCPKYTYEIPSVCKSCANCGGIIPNNRIGDDCPMLEKYPYIKQ